MKSSSAGTAREQTPRAAAHAVRGTRGISMPAPRSPQPAAAPALKTTQPIQCYVTLGREKTQIYHVFSGDTMKRLLTQEDLPSVMKDVTNYIATLPDDPKPEVGLSMENVAIWKGIKVHFLKNYGKIYNTLRAWIGARTAPLASLTGLDDKAEWREFESVAELALALAHETHPEYEKNKAQERILAGGVNESPWIREQLDGLLVKVNEFMVAHAGTYRRAVDPIEQVLFGSYTWANRVTSLFGAFKSSGGRGDADGQISQTRASITTSITFLHDLMERWSSSGAGSTAGKIHELLGVEDVIDNAQDEAFESTTIDPEASDFGHAKGPKLITQRSTKTVSSEEHQDVVWEITIKRAIRAAEKSMEDLDDISRLEKKATDPSLDEETRQAVKDKILRIKERIENRKARLASEGFGELTFNDNSSSSQQRAVREVRGNQLPEPGMLVKHLKAQQKERTKEKLKRVQVDKIDKSSKAKGRRNVGTRLEDNPDTLLARMFGAPIQAGRSMTTARMMQLVEKVGGTPEQKAAVAHALFAYWARTYNQGLTPVHTYHETMDVARNFGVPYKPFHYPMPGKEGYNFMHPDAFLPMSAGVPDFALENPGKKKGSSVPHGLHGGRWNEFSDMLGQLPVVPHPRVRGRERDPEEADPMNIYASVGSSSSSKDDKSAKDDKSGKPPKMPAPKPRFFSNEFSLIPNVGGGDCLFHAVEGRNLNERDLLALRRTVANQRLDMPIVGNMNTHNAMMNLSQTPGTRRIAGRLMQGRDNLPNNAYAALQAVPGMYAGEDELIQYCRYHRIRVGVADASGELSIYQGGGVQRIPYTPETRSDRLRAVMETTRMFLFKSPGHWERVLTINNQLAQYIPKGPVVSPAGEMMKAFERMQLRIGQFGEVQATYRRFAMLLHPDKHRDKSPEKQLLFSERMKQLNADRALLEQAEKDPKTKEEVLALMEK